MKALSELRMNLRELMSKSPVCDGPNFTLGLETAYRKMWQRYCKGDVPSLRLMEELQQQETSTATTIPDRLSYQSSGVISSKGASESSPMSNGFVPASSAQTLNLNVADDAKGPS